MSTTEATNVNPNLQALVEAGVSPWLDLPATLADHERRARAPDRRGLLRGITSNPSIFEKAILGSRRLRRATSTRWPARASTRRRSTSTIAIKDVQMATDVLRPPGRPSTTTTASCHWRCRPTSPTTRARPSTARATSGSACHRPNVMIKIPGTTEGVAAIEKASTRASTSTSRCCSPSSRYENVVDAYLSGLEKRLAEDKSLDVTSVASFFVSRVDTAVDKRLEASATRPATARPRWPTPATPIAPSRRSSPGRAGRPCTTPALTSSARCGPPPGSRTRATPDTMYVDELVGPHTVNTMPLATLEAFADHGHLSGPTAQKDPYEDLRRSPRPGST